MDRISSAITKYNDMSKKPRRSHGGVAARNWDNPYQTAEPYDVTESVARNWHYFTKRHKIERNLIQAGWAVTMAAQRAPGTAQCGFLILKRDGKLAIYPRHEPIQDKDIVLFAGCFKINAAS